MTNGKKKRKAKLIDNKKNYNPENFSTKKKKKEQTETSLPNFFPKLQQRILFIH